MSLYLCLKRALCVNKTIQQKQHLHEQGNMFKYEKCWKPALPVSTLIISSDRQNDHPQSKQQPCSFGEGHADRDKHSGYIVTWPASKQNGHFTHMNKLLSVPVNVHHRSTMSPLKPCNVSLKLDKSLSVCRCVCHLHAQSMLQSTRQWE